MSCCFVIPIPILFLESDRCQINFTSFYWSGSPITIAQFLRGNKVKEEDYDFPEGSGTYILKNVDHVTFYQTGTYANRFTEFMIVCNSWEHDLLKNEGCRYLYFDGEPYNIGDWECYEHVTNFRESKRLDNRKFALICEHSHAQLQGEV